MASPDQFPIEGPITANALQAATVSTVVQEAWVDGAALVYSATDGKLHPVVVEPAGGAIVSVTGIAPIGVSPGVAPVVSLSGVVDVAHGGTGSATGDASSLTNLPAAQLTGDAPLAALATALAAGGDPIRATVLTATTRVDAPTIGTSSATQHALPSGTADLLSADSSITITNKTISGASNTLNNIGNSSLTNSSLTVTASTGLAGGGVVSLGGSVSLSLPNTGTAGTYANPSSMTTDAQGRVTSVTAGSAGPSLPLSRANGGFGSDVSGLGTGLSVQTASNTWAARSIAQGSGITVSNGDGVAGNPTVALTSNSVTINTAGGITGGGAVALGSSLSLSLSAVPNAALANSSLTVTAGTGLSGGGAISLGGSVSLSIAATTVAASPYPASGQIPTFTVGTDGRLTAAGSTTTLTSPAIATPVFSGTATGTYTLGGTPSIAASALTGQLGVANGGTGTFTLTAHGVVLGQGTSNVNVTTAGTAGQVFTSGGASADGAYADPVGGTNSLSTLGSAFNITGTTGTYQDTGLSVSLPSAGTYMVIGSIRAEMNVSSGVGAFIEVKLRNNSLSSDIANSETICTIANTINAAWQGTTPLIMPVTVSGATTINVWAQRTFSGAVTTSNIDSDTNGRSRLSYFKINYV